jgi:hypothetical protein
LKAILRLVLVATSVLALGWHSGKMLAPGDTSGLTASRVRAAGLCSSVGMRGGRTVKEAICLHSRPYFIQCSQSNPCPHSLELFLSLLAHACKYTGEAPHTHRPCTPRASPMRVPEGVRPAQTECREPPQRPLEPDAGRCGGRRQRCPSLWLAHSQPALEPWRQARALRVVWRGLLHWRGRTGQGRAGKG